MQYTNVKRATFLERPNRFIARVKIDGREEKVHVRNTGRCREILKEGCPVLLEKAANPERKTGYSLIGAYKGQVLINVDSQVPNLVVYEGLLEEKVTELPGINEVSREVRYGSSRFDLAFTAGSRRGFIEVKGVTLEQEGVALFPDAPTERGRKHVYEMIKAVEEGYIGVIFFLIQMKGVKYFTPNKMRDPKLADALSLAAQQGVLILAYDSIVTEDGIRIGDPVTVRLA